MSDVVIVGAGISGAAAAWEAARAGAKVTVIDRYGPAAMASGWTLGGVRVSGRDPAEIPLALAAIRRWPELAAELGAPTGYHRHGNLRLARTGAEVEILREMALRNDRAGVGIRLVTDRAELRSLAPALSDRVLAATFCPDDGAADPVATVQAFLGAAERLGARMRFGETVLSLAESGGRVTGVVTDKGTIGADEVILACGIRTPELLAPLGVTVPLRIPMVSVVLTAPMPPVLAPVVGVANADCAGRQQPDGRFRVTSGLRAWHGQITDEPLAEGLRPAVAASVSGLQETLDRFCEVVPAFASARIERLWAGLIDLTPDALPAIGRALPGLSFGCGFSGHGFCLGPVTGQILSALALGTAPPFDLAAFDPARFADPGLQEVPLTLHG